MFSDFVIITAHSLQDASQTETLFPKCDVSFPLACSICRSIFFCMKCIIPAYLLAAPPSAESWLPVSLGVLTDLEGDTGVGTK